MTAKPLTAVSLTNSNVCTEEAYFIAFFFFSFKDLHNPFLIQSTGNFSFFFLSSPLVLPPPPHFFLDVYNLFAFYYRASNINAEILIIFPETQCMWIALSCVMEDSANHREKTGILNIPIFAGIEVLRSEMLIIL